MALWVHFLHLLKALYAVILFTTITVRCLGRSSLCPDSSSPPTLTTWPHRSKPFTSASAIYPSPVVPSSVTTTSLQWLMALICVRLCTLQSFSPPSPFRVLVTRHCVPMLSSTTTLDCILTFHLRPHWRFGHIQASALNSESFIDQRGFRPSSVPIFSLYWLTALMFLMLSTLRSYFSQSLCRFVVPRYCIQTSSPTRTLTLLSHRRQNFHFCVCI